jgi:hypothetical protein
VDFDATVQRQKEKPEEWTLEIFGVLNEPTVARPTALRPDNEDSVALEVLIPPVLPRVKQPDERAAFRIKSTQVRSLRALQW